jgi:hypothetical protein
MNALRQDWMGTQIQYHRANNKTMGRMNRVLEGFGSVLNILVIAVVVVDLVILAITAFHLLPEEWANRLEDASPWLLLAAAVLPAAVASLNGVLFQSESARLADRSGHLGRLFATFDRNAVRLQDQLTVSRAAPATALGSWTLEVLDLSDTCARVTLDEAAEWSALYAKAVREP